MNHHASDATYVASRVAVASWENEGGADCPPRQDDSALAKRLASSVKRKPKSRSPKKPPSERFKT
jgi:hypothetical protein